MWWPTYIYPIILPFTIRYPLSRYERNISCEKNNVQSACRMLQIIRIKHFVRGQDVHNLSLSFPKCRFHIHHCNMSQWSKSIHTVNDCMCDLTLSDPHNFISYSVLWYSVWVSLTSLITSKRFKKLSQTLNSSCPNWSDFVCCFGFIDWGRSTWILSKHGYAASDVCSAASSSMLNAGLFGSTISCTLCPISLQRFNISLLWKMSVFCFLTQFPSHKATINITW